MFELYYKTEYYKGWFSYSRGGDLEFPSPRGGILKILGNVEKEVVTGQ